MIKDKERVSHFLYLFDISEYPSPYFLTRTCELSKDFSSLCLFKSSKQAAAVQQIANIKFPNRNFQPDIIPPTIKKLEISNTDFWKSVLSYKNLKRKER